MLIASENYCNSQRAVAAKFGISRGVVNCVVKRKRELESLAEENINPAAKRVKTLSNEATVLCPKFPHGKEFPLRNNSTGDGFGISPKSVPYWEVSL